MKIFTYGIDDDGDNHTCDTRMVHVVMVGSDQEISVRFKTGQTVKEAAEAAVQELEVSLDLMTASFTKNGTPADATVLVDYGDTIKVYG